MKKLYFTIGLIPILMFCFISNVKAIDVEGAIEVDTLPTCDSTTKNNVYALSTDGHYHKCNEIGGGFRNILVGDNLKGMTIYYDFPDTFEFYNELVDYYNSVEITYNSYMLFRGINGNGTDSMWNGFQVHDKGELRMFYYGSKTYSLSVYQRYTYSPYTLVTNLSSSTFWDWDCIITAINIESPFYQHIKISMETRYSYEDLGEITEHIYFNHVNRDFYLFYDYETISNLDIFNTYDFTTFTDFQRLVIVIGFNTFYLGFLGLCIYILLKLVYKLLSWVL